MTGATEVLKQPKQVLARFPLVRNLKEHFIRVAAVADIICENWTGPTLDRDTIVAACLLHDVGNIMKIDFDSQWQQELMKRDKELIPEYKETQSRARAHFGNDTDAVRAGL